MKKILFLAALLLLLTTASGCRSRTSAAPRASGAQPQAASSDSGAAADGEPEALTENGGETVENPLAERAEYDEAARAELLENQSHAVSGEGEGGGLPLTQKDADSRALQLDSAAELAAVCTLPAEEAERLGVSESAPVAETAQRYYAALLQSRLRTLFECKKQNVYIETQTAFITVYKSSAEQSAGAFRRGLRRGRKADGKRPRRGRQLGASQKSGFHREIRRRLRAERRYAWRAARPRRASRRNPPQKTAARCCCASR